MSLHLPKPCFEVADVKYSKLNYSAACGPDRSVGKATGYGLDGLEIESRWEARFSAPVQKRPGVHLAFCTMGTGSIPRVKSGRGVTLTSHPF